MNSIVCRLVGETFGLSEDTLQLGFIDPGNGDFWAGAEKIMGGAMSPAQIQWWREKTSDL